MRIQEAHEAEVRRILQRTARDLREEIAAIPGDTFSQTIRSAQYESRAFAIDQLMNRGWGVIEDKLGQGINKASREAVEGMREYVKLMTKATGGDARDAARAIEEATMNAARNVQSRVLNDIDLSDRVWKNAKASRSRLDDIINKAIAGGDSAKELADEALGFVLPDAPGGMSFSAMRLARTELNNAFHRTETLAFEESPFVTAAQWNLSKSHPRPDDCDDFAHNDDGLGEGVFAADDIPGKPHPQCFCYITAVMMPQDDFIDGLLAGDFDDFILENTD